MRQLGFINEYYINNGIVTAITGKETTDFEISVYEVFKVVSGIPLFFEDHITRLENSLKYANINEYTVDFEKLYKEVLNCCKQNNKYFGNIELRISKQKQGSCKCIIGFIAHNYPSPTNYIEGVVVGMMDAERKNPNAKVKHSKTRIRANAFLKEHAVYEVLLENNVGEITEGSRSNVFFITDNKIITAPVKWVLPGITRQYVMKAIENLQLEMGRELVNSKDLAYVDAAFLCGTSIGILPIKSIGNSIFNTQNMLLRELMQEFNALVNEYLSEKSSN